MAVTVTTVHAGANSFIFDVEATADGDTTSGDVAHGLGAVPLDVSITPLAAAARVSEWIQGTVDGTNAAVVKGTGAGSGAAGAQVRVRVSLPHSIVG